MVVLCDEHNVEPIAEVFPWGDFPKAFDKIKNGKPHFRCHIDVGTWARENGFHMKELKPEPKNVMAPRKVPQY